MKKSLNQYIKKLASQLENQAHQQRIQLLINQDDHVLWSLFRHGVREALVVLFRRHHRQVVIAVYQIRMKQGGVQLADVQDACGDFVEQILTGKYETVDLKKDFAAFAVHHILFLLKSQVKTVKRRQQLQENRVNLMEKKDNAHLRIEKEFDLSQVIDLIPKIGNKVYRMVLYLIFIQGYNSQDLKDVFGKSSLAYDKRSRAMKAFQNLLEKEGFLEELR